MMSGSDAASWFSAVGTDAAVAVILIALADGRRRSRPGNPRALDDRDEIRSTPLPLLWRLRFEGSARKG